MSLSDSWDLQSGRHHVDPSVSESLADILESVSLESDPRHDLMRCPSVGVVCNGLARGKGQDASTYPTVGLDDRSRFDLGRLLFRTPDRLRLQTCADSRGYGRVKGSDTNDNLRLALTPFVPLDVHSHSPPKAPTGM